MPDRREELLEATAHREAPLAVLDDVALDANAADLMARADGLPIRVASKSLRVRAVLVDVLARLGFSGVMSFSLAESVWLADQGHDDVLLAYPSTSAQGFADLVAAEHRRAAITVMVDSVEHLDLVDRLLGTDHPSIRVCLDADASLRLGPLHLVARRSPVHTAEEAEALARAVAARPGFDLVGVMFYDAQIACLPDSSPAVRLTKRGSAAELVRRRAGVVEAVSRHAELRVVNAGGTGSLHVTGRDPVVTELAAGSGLFAPTLFDGYAAFDPRPAAYFALPVARRAADDVVTLFSGGFIASGPTGASRAPTPVWPEGLSLTRTEGAGEVQTPVQRDAARHRRIGDRVLLRPAKAGEPMERVDRMARVAADGTVTVVPTYRGERCCFG